MRGWLVPWNLVVASVGIACAPASPDTEDGGGAGDACARLRVIVDSPAADEVLGTWKAEVAGRVEGAGEIRHLFYEVDGRGVSLPAHTGPFSFSVDSERRREVRFAVRAQTVDGCIVAAERVLLFDTSRWVDLSQDEVAEVAVAAPGEEVVVHWRPKALRRSAVALEAWEASTRRSMRLDSWGPDGTTRITVQNRDIERWDFDLGVEPPMKALVIVVGTSLQMVPSRATVGVGEGQWITIPNATNAEWTVEPPAVLEPDRYWSYSAAPRAARRFEAAQPGTYTVRATSLDGKRVGEATIEVKDSAPPPVTIRNLPHLPDAFRVEAVAALPDGSVVAGGRGDDRPALYRLPRQGDAWIALAGFEPEHGYVSHLVVAGGELFALADGVLRIAPGGAVERILDRDRFSSWIGSIWTNGQTLYAELGSGQTYAFDAATGDWADAGGLGGCHSNDVISAVGAGGLWHTCAGLDWLFGPAFRGGALGALYDLTVDETAGLLAATSRGVHRLSDGVGGWEPVAGGGPSTPRAVFLRSEQRLLAGDDRGLWMLSRSDQTWIRMPVTPPSAPYFVVLPDGAIVMGSRYPGDAVEITIGE